MKKIYIVIENAFSYAGTEKVCSFMCNSFAEYANVTLISLKGSHPSFYKYKNNIEVITFNGRKHPLYEAVKLIDQDEAESTIFVITMGKLSVLFSFLMSLRYLSSKRNRSLKNIISCEHVALSSYGVIVKLLKYLMLRFYNNIVVLTHKDKATLTKWNMKSIVIPNSLVFHDHFKSHFNKVALAVGRLDEQKGFDILLSIWSKFIAENQGWTLNIAGDGVLKEKLIAQARDLKINESVNFLGLVHNIDECYKNSDIFLMTSRYEGLPLVLLEAKSWSLPCIAFDCPTGPAEIISDNKDGFIIPIDDKDLYLEKLNILAKNHAVRNEFIANTAFTAKRFEEKTILKLWNSLLN